MAITDEDQPIFYDRLLKRYEAAEKNLREDPDKCGGEEYIKGYMSGLIEGMALLNPEHKSICMESESEEELVNGHNFIKEVLFTEEDVLKRIPEIQEDIVNHYKKIDKPSVKVFSVLRGGKYFSDLLFSTMTDRKFQTGYISASSYFNNKKLPGNKIRVDLMGNGTKSLWGQEILIIDDIYDTGNTLRHINGEFQRRGAIVHNVVLVKRSGHHEFDVPILSYGFEVHNKDYLVGCGLDYNGDHRKLPYIASVKESKHG